MSERKLKVLQINKLYAPDIGGVERVAQQIAEGLAEQTQMQVLVCQKKGKRTEQKVNGIPVTRSKTLGTKFSMPISFGFFRDLRRLCREQDLLLFFAYASHPGRMGRALPKPASCPVCKS